MLATADTTKATEDKASTNNAKPDKVPSIDQLNLDVSSAVLIEPSTGQVLLSINADEALPPASMTKMMTEYIVAEKVKQGELAWDDVVTVGKMQKPWGHGYFWPKAINIQWKSST